MEPEEYDLLFPRGDTCPISLVLNDYNGNVLIPVAGDELYFTVKKSYRSKDIILQKRFSNGELAVQDGIVKFVIMHEDTASLKYGKYYYDIVFKSGEFVKTLVLGSITLTNEATWIENE